MGQLFTEDQREELKESGLGRTQAVLKKRTDALLADVQDLLDELGKPSDGIWDIVQGLSEDILLKAQSLRKLAKTVNRKRDSRGGGRAPWGR